MTLSGKIRHRLFNATLRLAPLGLLAIASYAQAGWTIVRADAPVTTIHAASVVQAEAGQRLGPDDIVETPGNDVVQIQDENGNLVALGPDTRALLTRDAHVALLRGWLKVLHACSAANCATPVVDTPRTRITPADHTSLVIAAAPAGYDGADAVFCESGSAQVLALGTAAGKPGGKPVQVQLDAHRFAVHRATQTNDAVAVTASPDPAFVAAMPLAFRDALRPLTAPAPPHNPPAHSARPVVYADIADWLGSTLGVRNAPATRFTERFRTRLSDPSFRRDIKQHLRELPDWQPLVTPRPRPAPRAPTTEAPSAYPSILVRP